MTIDQSQARSYVSPRPKRLTQVQCQHCNQVLPSTEFRVPGLSLGGPSLRMCRGCRSTGLWWCNDHAEAHPQPEFGVHASGLSGIFRSSCKRAQAEKAWRRRGERTYRCEACAMDRPPFKFPHVVRNYCVCLDCLSGHSGERWCRACGWAPLDDFTQPATSKLRNSRDVRCDPCAQAHHHNTTVAEILNLQGSSQRECAACRRVTNLHVDHDHACCGGKQPSCGKCVRGYLCRDCNRAEGALTSIAQAEGLLAYMRHWRAGEAAVTD